MLGFVFPTSSASHLVLRALLRCTEGQGEKVLKAPYSTDEIYHLL